MNTLRFYTGGAVTGEVQELLDDIHDAHGICPDIRDLATNGTYDPEKDRKNTKRCSIWCRTMPPPTWPKPTVCGPTR